MFPATKRPLNHEDLYVKSCELTLREINEGNGQPTAKQISYLQNLIQGYLLNFFFDKLSKYFLRQCGIELDNRMLVILGTVLSQKVFASVRRTFSENPLIVVQLSKMIVEFNHTGHHTCNQVTDFYRSILQMLYPDETDKELKAYILKLPEVKKQILIYRFEKNISNKESRCRFARMLDKEDPSVLMLLISRYFSTGRYKRFANMINNGEWRIEANFLKSQLSA